MKPFSTVTSIAAPLDVPNVDTDQIIPKQFLKRVERTGFGQFLFFDWRFQADGRTENPDFSLNKKEHRGAGILLARDNFGCGSSREHAPWALQDYGFSVIIAPSYADIFYNNCFQNGILPAIVSSSDADRLFGVVSSNPAEKFTVDLASQTISAGKVKVNFQVDVQRKEKLLKGLDDISWTLQFDSAISAHEKIRPQYN